MCLRQSQSPSARITQFISYKYAILSLYFINLSVEQIVPYFSTQQGVHKTTICLSDD